MAAPNRSGRLMITLALVLAVVLIAVVWAMLHDLVAGGAGYDYYSTYRTDPWGLSVFHDALSALPGIEVARNLHSIERAGEGYASTLLFAGAVHSADPDSVIEAIEQYVVSGGRLVIAFRPLGVPSRLYNQIRDDLEEKSQEAEEDTEGEVAPPPFYGPGMSWIDDAWGFRYSVTEDGDAIPAEPLMAKLVVEDTALPDSIAWYSTDHFEPKIPEWKTLYEVEGRAAVMEREWGQGSVVLTSDAYFLCNEAMVYHRSPAFLDWMIGDSTRVVIDETIHNVRQETGIMGLIRQYGLTSLLLAFAIVALLHVWRQATPLVPRHSRAREAEVAQEQTMRDAHAGLVRLLARSVPTAKLLPTVVAQWRRSLPHDSRIKQERLARIDEILKRDPEGAQPVATYREIAQVVKERI